jgi:hypothetical protein
MDKAIEPCEMRADVPTCLTTTRYDLMAALHAVVEPDDDALVVAIVARWLRTGRITFRGGGRAGQRVLAGNRCSVT